ncbi:MAG: hypothetical protein R3C58_09130 [Parvularculaceae bacterium]
MPLFLMTVQRRLLKKEIVAQLAAERATAEGIYSSAWLSAHGTGFFSVSSDDEEESGVGLREAHITRPFTCGNPQWRAFAIDVSYRERLQLCWWRPLEMIREDFRKRERMADLLQEEDIELLLQSAADSDRTIRTYASEFLYGLADARAFGWRKCVESDI